MDHPLFAQQLEALRKLKEKEERELLDGTVIRIGYRRRPRPDDQLTPRSAGRWTNLDLWAPSPLVDFDRNTTNYRIPSLLLTPVSKVAVPRGSAGETLPDYPDPLASVVSHFGYIERQHRAFQTALGHGEYIERPGAQDVSELGDISHIATNISRNPEKRKAFARAVYKFERLGKKHKLLARTEALAWWGDLASQPDAPGWVKASYKTFKKGVAEHERKARQKGKEASAIYVPICEVDEREAYDRIVWCTAQKGWDADHRQVVFKSAPGGRVQYRFVFQLPYWITAEERLQIVRKIARHLGKEGFMYVAAIHRPDAHNDPRNYHVHIDVYDRPCKFIKSLGMWDFEITTRDRNGDLRHREKQDKIEGFARSTDGTGHLQHGREMLQKMREIFCGFTNEVLEQTRSPLRCHPGPFEELGLDLRPTKKLGGKAMAAEANGLRTEIGDANALAIWCDVFDAIYRAHRDARKQSRERARELTKIIAEVKDRSEQDELRKRLARIKDEELQLVQQRFQFELAQAEIRMMRSRAETVIREAGRRGAGEGGKAGYRTTALARLGTGAIAEAQAHLDLIDRHGPPIPQVEQENANLSLAQWSVEGEWRALSADAAYATSRPEVLASEIVERLGPTEIRLSLDALRDAEPLIPAGQFQSLEIGRLAAWFAKNGGDQNRLSIKGDTLHIRAPQAVCTRLQKYVCVDQIRSVLEQAQAQLVPVRGVETAPDSPDTGRAVPTAPELAAAAPALVEPERDFVVADREFVEAELAADRSVDSNKLNGWRAQLASFDTPLVRSATNEFELLVDSDPAWVQAVAKGVQWAAESNQIARYLQRMVPLLPKATEEAEGLTSIPILTANEDTPAHMRADWEFVISELAEGRDVSSRALTIWRDSMACEDTPFFRSEANGPELLIENEPAWVDAVTAGLRGSIEDDQVARYLTHMAPLLPPAPRGLSDTISVSIETGDDDVPGGVKGKSVRKGAER